MTDCELWHLPCLLLTVILTSLLQFLELSRIHDASQDSLVQQVVSLVCLHLFKEVSPLIGMLLIQIPDLIDCLLVPYPEHLYQVAHIAHLFLQVLVVRLHQEHFLFLAHLFLQKFLLAFLLLLDLQLHLSVLSYLLKFIFLCFCNFGLRSYLRSKHLLQLGQLLL